MSDLQQTNEPIKTNRITCDYGNSISFEILIEDSGVFTSSIFSKCFFDAFGDFLSEHKDRLPKPIVLHETGIGAAPVTALAHHIESNLQSSGSDIYRPAINTARKNLERLGYRDQTRVYHTDTTSGTFDGVANKQITIAIANIAQRLTLPGDDQIDFHGGEGGTQVQEKFYTDCLEQLEPGTIVICSRSSFIRRNNLEPILDRFRGAPTILKTCRFPVTERIIDADGNITDSGTFYLQELESDSGFYIEQDGDQWFAHVDILKMVV